jgi:hypothetical protein
MTAVSQPNHTLATSRRALGAASRVQKRPTMKLVLLALILALGAGCNDVDCQDGGELEASYNSGQHDATAQTAVDYDHGHRDGLALTKADGERDGQTEGYHDGYADAYDAAYGVAYDDGYNAGIADGAATCESAARIAPDAAAPPPDGDAGVCYQRGYDQAIDRTAYSRGLAQGKLDNPDYQAGYKPAYAGAYAAGQSDGSTNGYDDGVAAGYTDGYAAGYGASYDACYAGAYDDGYSDGSTQGGDPGASDGYNAGYSDGYADGSSC